MKVFHGPQNIGGMAGVLARAQREIGIEASSYCFSTGNFKYSVDHEIRATGTINRTLELVRPLITDGFSHDVFQFYFGESLTGSLLLDVPWLKRAGKKVFFYFCGCDARDSKATIQKYEFSACKNCWPMACSANRKEAISTALRWADGIFVSTPDLLEFVPGSVWLPQPIDMNQFHPLREEALSIAAQRRHERDKIVIAHAPSNRAIKGTDYLENAVEGLKSSGYSVELLLIENTPYEKAIQLCAQADIVVDQLLVGSYGQYAVEMMALGKPVICYIREDLRDYYPTDLPVISANIHSIGEVLKELLARRSEWREIGRNGMTYVDHIHDSVAVAKKSVRHYHGE